MIPTVVDVSYRKAYGPSIPGVLEYSEVALVIVVFLAMAATLQRRAHIYTPFLTSRLSFRAAQISRLAGQVLMWIVLAIMVYGTALNALESFDSREFRFGLIEVPIWPAKGIVPIGLFMLLTELTFQIIECIGARNVAGVSDVG